MPKTRRKLQRKKSRKKRGGEVNPFMFKSTHKIQMGEMQKQIAVLTVQKSQGELSQLQNTLEEKYGKVQINIQDGTYTPIEENTEEPEEKE